MLVMGQDVRDMQVAEELSAQAVLLLPGEFAKGDSLHC